MSFRRVFDKTRIERERYVVTRSLVAMVGWRIESVYARPGDDWITLVFVDQTGTHRQQLALPHIVKVDPKAVDGRIVWDPLIAGWRSFQKD